MFDYEHGFLLVEDSTPRHSSVSDWVKALPSTLERIRIVTDIWAEAGELRNRIYSEFAQVPKKAPEIEIARALDRQPNDVFRWTFVERPSDKIAKVFFFGTPLCQILRVKYSWVGYNAEKVRTYLCIQAKRTDDPEMYSKVQPIYNFFKHIGYPVHPGSSVTLPPEIANGFRRCVETRLPEVSSTFHDSFNRSIEEHSFLVAATELF